MLTKKDITIIYVVGDEKKRIVTVTYKIADLEDTVDFIMQNGEFQVASILPSLKMGEEINHDLITAILDKAIEYVENLN